ncbi:MAG TPA: histidinol dehydrogenase, partial [Clostridium sp.]|nr:histidinol dehydrogenase [Clostridium sp.]
MIAGPSEIFIIADKSADPRYLAADMMSQAEHDVLASAVLAVTSEKLALKVKEELVKQIGTLERKDIILQSLKNRGAVFVVSSVEEGVDLANRIAPEHLELCISDPFSILGEVKNAGSVFMGNFSPEPLGDYMAGPNHILPTGGTAKFFSPLSVDDFIKKFSFTHYSKKSLLKVSGDIMELAR